MKLNNSGIFPHSWDGGIPANPDTPDNPPQAFQPRPLYQPTDTSANYYGLGCDTRIRAAVMNSIISEIIAVCDRAGVAYTAAKLDNLATAIFGPAQHADDIVALRQEVELLKREVATLRQRTRVPA